MHKFVSLYRDPIDPEVFRSHYVDVHIPLMRKLPGLLKVSYSFDVAVPEGEPSWFAVAEYVFASEADMAKAMDTPEGQAVRDDIVNAPVREHSFLSYPVNGDL